MKGVIEEYHYPNIDSTRSHQPQRTRLCDDYQFHTHLNSFFCQGSRHHVAVLTSFSAENKKLLKHAQVDHYRGI